MKQPELVILAAGMGSRYGGLKQLDRVGPGGATVLDYSIYDALKAGFGRVVFVTRRDIAAEFEQAVVSKWEKQVDCVLAFQDLNDVPDGFRVPEERAKPWGTAHAIRAARHVVRQPFAAINADDFYGRGAFQVLADYLRSPLDDATHAMVAFQLAKTLSSHGSVSRGVCLQGGDGMLSGIREYTQVSRRADGSVWDEPEGADAVQLTGMEPVSMNCWGFLPSIFPGLDEDFARFLREEGAGSPKAEFTIPGVVDLLIQTGRGRVKLVETDSQWFGVTYRDDRPDVVERIARLTADGVYPADVWQEG